MSRTTPAVLAMRRKKRARAHAILEWARSQPGVFRSDQVAEAFGLSQRTAYRYLADLRPWLRSEAGVGYLTRKEPVYV